MLDCSPTHSLIKLLLKLPSNLCLLCSTLMAATSLPPANKTAAMMLPPVGRINQSLEPPAGAICNVDLKIEEISFLVKDGTRARRLVKTYSKGNFSRRSPREQLDNMVRTYLQRKFPESRASKISNSPHPEVQHEHSGLVPY